MADFDLRFCAILQLLTTQKPDHDCLITLRFAAEVIRQSPQQGLSQAFTVDGNAILRLPVKPKISFTHIIHEI